MAPTFVVEYTQHKASKKRSQDHFFTMLGKTHRFSRGGYSSNFVPDYGHAAETMVESEGFSSCGRVDEDMAASEDSRAPKRKCLSLNGDRGGCFDVPLEVISLTRLSRPKRMELEIRLRSELEQVRIFQKKISLRSTNGLTVSSSGEGYGYSDGLKRPMRENIHKSLGLPFVIGKEKLPAATNGPSLRQGHPVQPINQSVSCINANVMLMKQCEALLKRLMTHQHGWVFNAPVDVVKLNIPDYFSIIKHPMDLGTIKNKLALGSYLSPRSFAADVRLTFSNAMIYNPPGNDVHKMADTLSKFFEMRWKSIEKKLPIEEPHSATSKLDISREKEIANTILSKSKKNKEPANQKVIAESGKRKMTNEERQSLNRHLESLQEEMPECIVSFLREHSCISTRTSEDEVEVDMDTLDDNALFKLRTILDDYLRAKGVGQAKTEPCELELLNESGLSNSSARHCKGNDLVEENVDIGGNNPPVLSYPAVDIEKDTIHRSSNCSRSSSSSSKSSSSSSDSDSCSSSKSESAGGKATSLALSGKLNLDFGATTQERSEPVNFRNGISTVKGPNQRDQNNHPISIAAGENAPSERQVSPEKLYRAALLRSRFADTILKAREKTLNEGEKGDPEKLRREREQHERQQREEKSRLQAEAKAAEEARKQAKEEAAAAAKRKLELDREAAREALQKMQRTVEIDENCHFLKDLELLGSAPEYLPSSADETSPDHTHDGLGGFKLGGSNLLQQLGLYMKVDDDEEECEQDNIRIQQNDVEEGEID